MYNSDCYAPENVAIFSIKHLENAHLEEDVGRVQVTMADAATMHVLHACCDSLKHMHAARPPVRRGRL